MWIGWSRADVKEASRFLSYPHVLLLSLLLLCRLGPPILGILSPLMLALVLSKLLVLLLCAGVSCHTTWSCYRAVATLSLTIAVEPESKLRCATTDNIESLSSEFFPSVARGTMDAVLNMIHADIAPRPVQGLTNTCMCCNLCPLEDFVSSDTLCVVCGAGPMCDSCSWHMPVRCCVCMERSGECPGANAVLVRTYYQEPPGDVFVLLRADQQRKYGEMQRRHCLLLETFRLVKTHRYFHSLWVFIASTGLRLYGPDSTHRSFLRLQYRASWEMLYFLHRAYGILLNLLDTANEAPALCIVVTWIQDGFATSSWKGHRLLPS